MYGCMPGGMMAQAPSGANWLQISMAQGCHRSYSDFVSRKVKLSRYHMHKYVVTFCCHLLYPQLVHVHVHDDTVAIGTRTVLMAVQYVCPCGPGTRTVAILLYLRWFQIVSVFGFAARRP